MEKGMITDLAKAAICGLGAAVLVVGLSCLCMTFPILTAAVVFSCVGFGAFKLIRQKNG